MKFTNVLALIAGAAASTAAFAGDVSRDEVRSIVAEALADAQTRSSLLQGGGAAGYDKGFYIASPNGDWKMNINGAVQFRYMFDFRNKDHYADNTQVFELADGYNTPDDISNGFQMRRAYLSFSGNMVNPNLEYCLRLITADAGRKAYFEYDTISTHDYGGDLQGNSRVMFDDMYMRYNFGNGWHVKAGQFKGAFLKENSNSDVTTMAVERGIMFSAFDPGHTQGVSFDYQQDQWRFVGELTDGFNAAGSDFQDAPADETGFGGRFNGGSGESEYAVTLRLEYLVSGKWDALKDYTSKPGDASSWYIGGAAHYEQSTNVPESVAYNRTSWFGLTADSQWEGNGWGVFGAIAMASANTGDGYTDTTDYGACFQLSYRWDEAPELFIRWDGIFADSDRRYTDDTMHFLTFGYNNYFAGNACKLSIDCIVALNATEDTGSYGGLAEAGFTPGWNDDGYWNYTNNGAPALNTANGLQGQTTSGEFAIRAQWQVAF